jgi:hypothetical protein
MGQWAEIGEGILDLELLAYRNCRRSSCASRNVVSAP